MRLHRLIAILLLIESRESVKAKELANILETSLRTIHRDIEVLCESGIPIKTTTGPNGGISFMEGYKIQMDKLQCDDVISLFLSGIGVHPNDDSESRLSLKKALLKLENSLPKEYIPDVKIARDRFYYDPSPWWLEKLPVPYLPVIRKSVLQTKKLAISYEKMNGHLSQRIVEPYGLVVKAMDWYLIALCETSRQIRIFKCERIQDATVLEETFSYPDAFDLEHFWMENAKSFKSSRQESELYPVQIRLSVRFSHILESLDVIDRLTKDDMVYATINLHSFELSKQEVLDIIGFSEILMPMELRLYVQKALFDMSSLYQI